MYLIILFVIISVIITLLLCFNNKEEFVFPIRRPYHINYKQTQYPQALIQETCLNKCCDYEKCTEGKGCKWRSIKNDWLQGTPLQCQLYKECIDKNLLEKMGSEKIDKKCRSIIGIL